MTTKKKPTKTAPKESTSATVASEAGFILSGDHIINQALGFISDVDLRSKVKKYQKCAKAAAASALTQKE